jgi:hypothetical protein
MQSADDIPLPWYSQRWRNMARTTSTRECNLVSDAKHL